MKTYSSTVKSLGKTYSYKMVGTNPEVHSAAGNSTTVTALLVPVIIKFSGGPTWNPTTVDSCDTGATPVARTQKSPLFVNRAWSFGGTSVGTGQYLDAFERAEFWHYTQPDRDQFRLPAQARAQDPPRGVGDGAGGRRLQLRRVR